MYAKYSPFIQEPKVVVRNQDDHLKVSTEAMSTIVTMTDDGVLYLGNDDGEGVCSHRVTAHTSKTITNCHAHAVCYCGQITILDLECVENDIIIEHPVYTIHYNVRVTI